MRLEWFRAALIAARNVVVGSNLSSLRLIRQPRKMVGYHAEALFMLDAFAKVRGLPERHVLDVLPQEAPVTVRLSHRTDSLWIRAVTSYLADLVGLCLLCQVLRPRSVFEIGTLNGYSAFHFALNTPPEATVFTLDLPPGDVALAFEPTLLDRDLVRYGAAATRYAFTDTEVEGKVRPLKGDFGDLRLFALVSRSRPVLHRWSAQLRLRAIGHGSGAPLRASGRRCRLA